MLCSQQNAVSKLKDTRELRIDCQMMIKRGQHCRASSKIYLGITSDKESIQSAASSAPKETETGVAISQKAKKLLLVHLGMLYATTHKMFILVCNKIQSSQSKPF